MKTTEEMKKYREMDLAKLQDEANVLAMKYAETTLKIKAGKESNFSSVSKVRKNIARLNTIISEKSAE